MKKYCTGECKDELVKEKIYLSAYSIGGVSTYHNVRHNPSVFFVDEDLDVCRQLVDQWGNIRNFPGIDYDALFVEEYGKHKVEPIVKFGAQFVLCPNDCYMMIWTVRPDGRYWMDHWGFGAEDYEDVRMYSYIDKKGNFVQPFRLYSIGDRLFGEYALNRDMRRAKR